jgi:hypothetical protein
MFRFPAATPGKLTILALIGMAVTHMVSTLVFGDGLNTFAIVFELVLLGLAVLVTTRKWWSYALAALVSTLLFLATFTGSGDRLADPGDPAFISLVLFLGFALVAVVAGIWSAVQTVRISRAEA